ncbi:MAG TPA: diguanylate cyclase [Ramlibacter sp.]|jgi:hypothetical protein|uniref:diguanylate cyclase n=1 Tax=Ramlibacter sp. TaxID=1917967 RepID=UPI002D457700|nr:diguanylate cyclase [Ramlibacter sp.]HZY17294.1 diguanylate cyclase [Ramlibacter sp.]
MADAARLILVYAVFPVWVAVGLADWACHKATSIATTSGLRENLLHQLMFAQVGCAIVAMALLEINAAVLLIVASAFVLHELTVWADLRWSLPRRRVTAFEQMVHSFQEILPLLALALLATMRWDQALALLGLGDARPDWRLRWKEQPLPPPVLLAGFAAAAVFNALPLAEETWSCLKARTARRP